MSSIKDGIYSLTKPEDNAATIIIASGPSPPNKTILCLPQTYGPEAQVSRLLIMSRLRR